MSLAPLALRRYLDAPDLRARLLIFLAACAGAFVYLKVISARQWAAAGVSPWRQWLPAFEALAPRKKVLILSAAALLLFNSGALLMSSRGATFSGDEPHYLLITHSLLHDHDFDLANNYAQKDYLKFMRFNGEIAAHVVSAAKRAGSYSFHSPGVSFFLLPFYAVGELFGRGGLVFFIRLGMSLWGALFGVQVYLLARQQWGKEGLALGLWCLTTFTSPVFFYSFHVYPEIVVACLSLIVYRLLRYSPSLGPARASVCGLFLGSFIWFHAIKYLALLFPLYIYGIWSVRKKSTSRAATLLFILIPAAIILIYLQFQHSIYGTYSIFAVSWARPLTAAGGESIKFIFSSFFGIPLRDQLETLAGYFLDQRDGLLFYAPIYFFVLLGAWELLKKKRGELGLLLFVGAPYVLLAASLTQRSGYAPQARPLVAVIWVMIIGLGYFLESNKETVFGRLGNLAAGVGLLFVGLLLFNPLCLYQETTRGATDRGAGLFYLLSNLHFRLTNFLPSYLKVEDRRWPPNIVWLAILVLFVAAYAASKKREIIVKHWAHVAAACAAVALAFVWFALYPRLVLVDPRIVKFPSGDRVTFYSLSRSARMAEAGQFFLREDGRAYRFYFTTEKPLSDLTFVFGSEYGEYDTSLRMFDEPLFEKKPVRRVESFDVNAPPRYDLGRESLYAVILELGKGTGTIGDRTPYRFAMSLEGPAR